MQSVVKEKTAQINVEKKLKVERIFDCNSKISIEDIIFSLIDKKIASIVEDFYHQVNTVTSHEERGVSA